MTWKMLRRSVVFAACVQFAVSQFLISEHMKHRSVNYDFPAEEMEPKWKKDKEITDVNGSNMDQNPEKMCSTLSALEQHLPRSLACTSVTLLTQVQRLSLNDHGVLAFSLGEYLQEHNNELHRAMLHVSVTTSSSHQQQIQQLTLSSMHGDKQMRLQQANMGCYHVDVIDWLQQEVYRGSQELRLILQADCEVGECSMLNLGQSFIYLEIKSKHCQQ